MPDHTPPIRISAASDNGPWKEFERRYEEHFRRLAGMFGSGGRDRGTAEDLAQETLLRAYASLPRFDGSRPMLPWIKAIARCVAADHDRRPRPDLPVELGDGPSIPSETASVDERGILDAARGRLTRRHDLAVRLRYIEDREPRQAAEVLGMTISAFNQLLFRARQRLREEYQRLSDGVPVLLWLRRRRSRCQAFGHRVQRSISRASSRLNESADKLASAAALSLCVVLLPLAPLGTAPSPEAVAASLEPGPRAGAAGSARPGQDRDPASTVSGRIDRSIDPSSARSGETSSEVAAGAEPPRDENPGPKPPAPEASPPGEAGADPPPAPASAPPADLSPPATPTLPEDPGPENAPAVVGGQGPADVEVARDPEEAADEVQASVERLVGDPTQSIDTDLIDP